MNMALTSISGRIKPKTIGYFSANTVALTCMIEHLYETLNRVQPNPAWYNVARVKHA